MNTFKAVFLSLVLVAASIPHASADSSELREPEAKFWNQVKAMVVQCAVQTFTEQNGSKVYGPLRSICPELEVNGSEAQFRLRGDTYSAKLQESADADEGDLDDVFVYDRSGAEYAERHDIAAFGDVLLGLAGGKVQLPERYVEELDIFHAQ